ncbi:MAG: DUF2225 domain-containing protein [Myxococcales bacterium]
MPPVEFQTLGLRCPVCSTEFTSEIPLAGMLEARDTDFRPRYVGPDPLAALIQTCPTCRYTAYPRGFERHAADDDDELTLSGEGPWDRPAPEFPVPEEEDLEALRRWIRRGELVRGIAEDREPYGAERYLLGARCYDFLNDDDALALADYYLRGAWCARATGERDLERRCLREALQKVQAVLDEGNVSDTKKARFTYLLAELNRRVGEFARAVDLFGQVEALVDPDEREGATLAQLARRQMSLAMIMSDVNAQIETDDA